MTHLFGRQDERAAIERAVTDARLGASRVMVVRGDPGILLELLRPALDRSRAELL